MQTSEVTNLKIKVCEKLVEQWVKEIKLFSKNIVISESNDEMKVKNEIRKNRKSEWKTNWKIRSKMSEKQQRMNTANQETRSYNWLIALPLKEFLFDLNKKQFLDSLRIRSNWVIPKLASECARGSKLNVQHAI